MQPRPFLRLEGLTVFSAALAGYFVVDGPVWLLLVFALAPDLAMVAYLAGPRIGSLCYNVFHTYTLPATVGAIGIWADITIALLVALIWTAHIGADRLVGYGLKFESGFKETHLSTQPVPVPAFGDSAE